MKEKQGKHQRKKTHISTKKKINKIKKTVLLNHYALEDLDDRSKSRLFEQSIAVMNSSDGSDSWVILLQLLLNPPSTYIPFSFVIYYLTISILITHRRKAFRPVGSSWRNYSTVEKFIDY